jgi:hypothetical protein
MDDVTTMEGLGFVEGMEGSAGRGGMDVGGVPRFYGKYRGVVRQNVDPDGRGRLMVTVTDVYGPNISSWAMPCVPWAGIQQGTYVVPALNTGVWVEFEHGDPDYPIWTGCWWGSRAEVPLDAQTAVPSQPVFIVGSMLKNTVAVADSPLPPLKKGGVLLRSGPACYIAVEPDGVTIVAPKITVLGTTNINAGALVVT